MRTLEAIHDKTVTNQTERQSSTAAAAVTDSTTN